jgi:RNA polymerase-binding transcription factor DksA
MAVRSQARPAAIRNKYDEGAPLVQRATVTQKAGTMSANKREIRERLEARRQSLLSRYRSASDRLSDPADAEARYGEEPWVAHVLMRMTDVDLRTLESVVRALRRLDGGTYGICCTCDEPIEPARLAAIPEAAECVDCVRFADDTPSPWRMATGESTPLPRPHPRPASEPTA